MRAFMKQRLWLLLAILSVLTLYILTVATGNSGVFSQYFWWVLAFAGFVFALLCVMIARAVMRLWRRSRRGDFGSQTARKLSYMFALVAVLPGLFLFGVSAQFIRHSIGSWFGDDTAQALESSLNVSKAAVDLAAENTRYQAQELLQQVMQGDNLKTLATRHTFDQLVLFSHGASVASYNPQGLPAPKSFLTWPHDKIEVENINGTLFAQGYLMSNEQEARLFFRQSLPKNLVQTADLIEAARAKYAGLSYAKQGLQTFFLATLLMATLLAIGLALMVALSFAQHFVRPIFSLTRQAGAVARGDLSAQPFVYRNDELGRLQNVFSHMTDRLRLAHSEQEAARHYLERILNSLSSGVMTFDTHGKLKTFNQAAEIILDLSLSPFIGQPWQEINSANGETSATHHALGAMMDTIGREQSREVDYPLSQGWRILLGKAELLPFDSGGGTVLVFDDVTLRVRAQKEAAWSEVAQRLAHEIRNPLTPIQLSAERLAAKLANKLNDKDAAILQRATDTIVQQVGAMNEMVEAFRQYARAPLLKPAKLDWRRLASDVLALYEGARCQFQIALGDQPVMVFVDPGAMRQVMHNILRNAAEAALESESPKAWVVIAQSGNFATLSVRNNGKQFSAHMLTHAFDPYVTDKPAGTGLGLPVVKKIIDEHCGKISIANGTDEGACVTITLPLIGEDSCEVVTS